MALTLRCLALLVSAAAVLGEDAAGECRQPDLESAAAGAPGDFEALSAEAQAASTILLQAGLSPFRGPRQASVSPLGTESAVEVTKGQEDLPPCPQKQQEELDEKAQAEAVARAYAHGRRPGPMKLAALQMGAAAQHLIPAEGAAPRGNFEDDTSMWPIYAMAKAGLDKDDTDPLWASTHELIRRKLLEHPDAKAFADLCINVTGSASFEKYSARGCVANSTGSMLIGGVPADAYFCGSQRSGIDWSKAEHQVSSFCEEPYGSAYSERGVCGRLTKKQLVLNFFETVPKWKENPLLANVPSLNCILGLGDCDLFYCQHCAGRCGPAPPVDVAAAA